MKSDAWNKYQPHIEYCKRMKPGFNSQWDNLFNPIQVAIDTLWSKNPETSETLQDFIFNFVCYEIKYRNKYKNKFGDETYRPMPVVDNFLCEFKLPEIITPEEVYKATSWDLIGAPLDNDLILQFKNEIENGDAGLITNLEWLKKHGTQWKTIMIDLFEDRGELTEEVTIDQLKQELYINKGLKEIISLRELNVYIPTGVR